MTFTPKRSTARYHSTTCRSRAARARAAAEHQQTEAAKTGTSAEHELVRVVREQLTEVGALETVPGQLALQVARRIADPEQAGISTLSKELRALLREVGIEPTPPGPARAAGVADEPSTEVDGEAVPTPIQEARRKRDEARAAAGRA